CALVLAGDAARSLCAALDWPDGPVLRARVRATADGSAKPSEVARALGVWGPDDPRAAHALVARLGVVASDLDSRDPGPGAPVQRPQRRGAAERA
ncbi:MAG TPA: hypothetical protein VK601_20715, partial [Kofleriaceae bacterium]|nr:hypothetical protein [Kofleriaceae bacterium]